MSDQQSSRWIDLAYLALFAFLMSLWILFPPQRIDPSATSVNRATGETVGAVHVSVNP